MAQQLSNQRIAWFNGKFMPEGQVMIPFRDRSWKYGDGAFDMTRTFEGQPFRLKEHIDRFYRSLRYLQIDPGIGPKEMVAHSEEVVARNEHLRAGDRRLVGRPAGQPRRRRRRRRRLGPYRPQCRDRGAAAAARQARQALSRRRRGHHHDGAPHRAVDALAARQDAQLSQHDHGREAGEGARPPTPGRSCSTRTAIWPRGWAATSSSSARASSSRRRSATCCRASAGR